jgi:hypothetical protein
MNIAIFVNRPNVFTRKCGLRLLSTMVSETKDAHSQRAFLSAIPPGEASAVKVETRGKGAFYLDGVSEPYNCRRKALSG